MREAEYLPLLGAIDARMRAGGQVIVAIDGPCAAGKTTLGARLKSCYECNVISIDSFFLRPEQRTEARLREPGGNIDYERAEEELLRPLRGGMPFSYRPYDCGTRTLVAPILVTPRALNIIEGVYSLHPRLARYYDLKVFLTVDAAEQARRLLARNAALYPRFTEEWLPMEALYFETFQIAETCDVTLCAMPNGKREPNT